MKALKEKCPYLYFFLILVLQQCETETNFDVATQENKLVVNSFIGPETGTYTTISLSKDPLDYSYNYTQVEDASIDIYKNGIFLNSLLFNDTSGLYTISADLLNASALDEFKITIQVPGKESISATSIIPADVVIENAEIVDTIAIQQNYYVYDSLGTLIFIDTVIQYYKIEIEFTDQETANYYSLSVAYKDAIQEFGSCFYTNDPVYTFGGEFEFNNNSEEDFIYRCDDGFFADITFNGSKKKLTIYLLFFNAEFYDEPFYEITLKHLSEEYYQYFNSTILQYNNYGNPFAQPVSVYSNIEGGFGIFASFNESKFLIDL